MASAPSLRPTYPLRVPWEAKGSSPGAAGPASSRQDGGPDARPEAHPARGRTRPSQPAGSGGPGRGWKRSRHDREPSPRSHRRDPGRCELERAAHRRAVRLVVGWQHPAWPGARPDHVRVLARRRGRHRAVSRLAAGPRGRPCPGGPAGGPARPRHHPVDARRRRAARGRAGQPTRRPAGRDRRSRHQPRPGRRLRRGRRGAGGAGCPVTGGRGPGVARGGQRRPGRVQPDPGRAAGRRAGAARAAVAAARQPHPRRGDGRHRRPGGRRDPDRLRPAGRRHRLGHRDAVDRPGRLVPGRRGPPGARADRGPARPCGPAGRRHHDPDPGAGPRLVHRGRVAPRPGRSRCGASTGSRPGW
jgi:hypothetical protein